MRPTTYRRILHERLVSTNASDVKQASPPGWASAIQYTVETTNGRMTLDGSDPTAGSPSGHIIPAGQPPILALFGPSTILKWVSTAGTPSVLQLTYLD